MTPSSRLSSASSASTLAPFSESRLPVGSSATSSAGSMHERARDRRALHLAAGDLLRVVRQPMRDADALGQRAGPRFGLGAASCRPAGRAARCCRASVSVGSRLKNWNTKPIRSRRTRVSSSSPSADEVAAVERERAAGRPIHGAAQVQQRRLAAARRPHQRDEVAALERERHAGERGHARFTGDVSFLEVVGDQKRASDSSTSCQMPVVGERRL